MKIYDKISKLLYKKNNLFILGKGKNIAIAESSLKIKEVCYIHAEGYSGRLIKTWTIWFIDKRISSNFNRYNTRILFQNE